MAVAVSLGLGTADSDTGFAFSGSDDTSAIALFAGARFQLDPVNSGGLYAGVEAEIFRATGHGGSLFDDFEEMDDVVTGIQGELHLGYSVDTMRFYGFIGRGSANIGGRWVYDDSPSSKIHGVGAEFDIGQKMAVRVEHAITKMHVDACSSYDVKRRDTSVGLVIEF